MAMRRRMIETAVRHSPGDLARAGFEPWTQRFTVLHATTTCHQSSPETIDGTTTARSLHKSQRGSSLTMTSTQQHLVYSGSPKKRKFDENSMDYEAKENRTTDSVPEVLISHRRKFLAVPRHGQVYETETVHPKQPPMYTPILDDLLINTDSYEQISFSTGQCFLADSSGNYADTQEGHIINFWKYDEQYRKLHICRSLFFMDSVIYLSLRRQLEGL